MCERVSPYESTGPKVVVGAYYGRRSLPSRDRSGDTGAQNRWLAGCTVVWKVLCVGTAVQLKVTMADGRQLTGLFEAENHRRAIFFAFFLFGIHVCVFSCLVMSSSTVPDPRPPPQPPDPAHPRHGPGPCRMAGGRPGCPDARWPFLGGHPRHCPAGPWRLGRPARRSL